MTYCPKCGAELRPNAKFCHRCGTEVRAGIVPQEAMIEERGEVEKIPSEEEAKEVTQPPLDLSGKIELEKCKRYGKGYNIVCPSCHETNIIQSSAFTTDLAERSKMGVTATDERIPVTTGISSLAILLIIIVASILATYIAGIPFGLTKTYMQVWRDAVIWLFLFFVFGWIFFYSISKYLFRSFARKLPVWLVQCKKCRERIVLASDGSKAFIVRKSRKTI